MAVPKQHDSKSKVGKRRSQKNLKKQNLHTCSNCNSPKLAHRACSNCGAYKEESKKDKPMAQKEEIEENEEKQEKEEETAEEVEQEEASEESKEDKETN